MLVGDGQGSLLQVQQGWSCSAPHMQLKQGPAMALQMQPLWFWQRLCTGQEKQPFSGSMGAEGVKTEAGRSGVRKEPMSLEFPQISHRIIA